MCVCIEKSKLLCIFLRTLAFIDGNSVSLIDFERQRHACARFGVILLPITASMLSKGAMVCLIEKNFEPEWSLFNNSIGEVEEIVFRDGDNPNNGDQPCYIAVKFPQYSGPAWDPQKPKVSVQSFFIIVPKAHSRIIHKGTINEKRHDDVIYSKQMNSTKVTMKHTQSDNTFPQFLFQQSFNPTGGPNSNGSNVLQE